MSSSTSENEPSSKVLSAQAKRALEEAQVRREKRDAEQELRALEVDGREGLEPTRYGDWEKNGILSDF